MKCAICPSHASFVVTGYTNPFCPFHFRAHIFRQVSFAIDKYRLFGHDKKILVPLTGKENSFVLAEILSRMNFDIIAVHINHGFGDYSRIVEETAHAFATKFGIFLEIYRIEELLGFTLDKAVSYSLSKTCTLCRETRRYYLNRLAVELGCDVIATAQTLDDETSLLIGSILNWQMDHLPVHGPLSPEEKGTVGKAKPLVRLTDHEVHMYAELAGIYLEETSCPHAKGVAGPVYKKVMEAIEWEMPGTKEHFYSTYLKSAKYRMTRAEAGKGASYHCPCCGYKIIRKNLCLVCMLKEKASRGEYSLK